MKFASIFFAASAAIFLTYHKDSNKRAKYKACFNISLRVPLSF